MDPIVLRDLDRGLGSQIPLFLNLLRRQNIPKECLVCAEEKFEIDYGSWEQWSQACGRFSGPWTWTVLEYPISANQHCTHSLDVCRLCVAKHISVSLENGNFEHITCPQCDRLFTYNEIKKLCHDDTFREYDKRLLLHTLCKEPNFRWCLSLGCESGQIHDNIDPTLAAVQCQECEFRMCFRHERPWHDGLTCAEFEDSLEYGDPKYKETQAIIEKSTKACPNCNVRIEKGPGCFHMTCKYTLKPFCWECLVSWHLVKVNYLNHRPDCFFRRGALTPTQVTGTDLGTALRPYAGIGV
ncbi:uncharacterized protein BDZ99DRAFT_395267 [Mytilinidion resinicola]|uniref:RBR-type E3 ubiquitin transferase n=1 Tax=Mytilinidion resinicola TaxID=574789 RepID=A0A6A6YAV5_9PEZI|nr:uncharacterized protein BDZ99DRAFT_395267 [Mytilinidion resinicola]KAF2805951.1 hypothetical protein BDZ99DRAFT_395267 [Mytilinidion resinicola]